MLERLKSEPYAWHMKNMVAMRRVATRPDFKIYNVLSDAENVIIDTLMDHISSGQMHVGDKKSRDDLSWFFRLIFRLILTSIHTNNRLLIQNYFEISGVGRISAGYSQNEIKELLRSFNNIILSYLQTKQELREFQSKFYDYITMPIEFAIDEIEHQYILYQQKGAEIFQEIQADPQKQSARELLEETIWNCLVHRK